MRTRSVLAAATAALAAATCLTTTGAGPARAHASTRACSPSVRMDGFSDALDKTTFQGSFVGNFSALATDEDGTVAAVSDRSQLFSLDVEQHSGGAPSATPVRAVNLADEKGGPIDSEGLVVDRDGTRLVTSETEPSVRRYDRDGRLLGRLPVPEALQVAPAGRAAANQTFEGLTLQPGGRTLIASMEQALAGDGTDAAGRPLVRLQSWQRQGRQDFAVGPQYAYPADRGLGVAEITAAGDGRLLVLERGFTAGVGNTVRLYLADPRRASDVTAVTNLPGGPGVRPVPKTLLADIGACPSLGATARQPQPNPLLDNIEGLAVTRPATGRNGGFLRLLLVSDDNQNPAQVTRLYSLTVRLPRP
ncbi:esterase-like activity of phytase family protein [Streptomyces telluris]|uniref:Esterase-like activity of phytase family protein n=1 Tax=Streptomyces telluris TaxID=2720021 RepID=A0A9X2RLC2_9ACTN|nr:esterase-like activity of phytase family protein [Streptomyces telluris]MCQ8770728.1 esterase-like activity of phytase family protein [Streptomyces telluris]NJP76951.1 esterase-like activity of phytase family protein [Streptomyces telluris]